MKYHDGVASGASASDRAQRDAAPHPFSPPRRVTRGETHDHDATASPDIAFIDWLAFTVTPPQTQDLQWVKGALATVFAIPDREWKSTGRGWNGYLHRIDLGAYGLLAFGGEKQRGTYHAELNAHACKLIQDWNAVRLWGDVYKARITRADLAHDDHAGTQINIASARNWLLEHRFDSNGRPPTAELIDDLGSDKGKTLYVGSRGSGKLLRVYEKGKQLGDKESSWVRAEVELRNKSRLIPWDVVIKPGQYLAGSYPALRFLTSVQLRVRTIQRTGQISYERMVKNLRTQGGKSLNVMCQVLRGDAAAVLAEVVVSGVPKRLAGFSTQELREVCREATE